MLSKWQNEPNRIDKRSLALIYMAHASDVLENAFAPLSDDDYELAMKRVRDLLDCDPDVECTKPNSNDILWSVVAPNELPKCRRAGCRSAAMSPKFKLRGGMAPRMAQS